MYWLFIHTACPINTYGRDCRMVCRGHCKHGCNHVTGTCDNGCDDGWQGKDCTKGLSIYIVAIGK